MGGKPSVHIETPQFQEKDWEYLPDNPDPPEEYGLFRTLRNIKTGEKIDEYEFMWPDEEQYQYYLKSFNWRYKQTNVVSTKFIVQRSRRDMCSRSFMARVYIEHMRVRLSQISDIPYPDNLYVLMEALEGYRKIFDHSKYFQIEENQICVDDYGNLKIWVNSDLSINYPNNQGFIDYKQKGQEEMVQTLVNIISQNTDPDTQPSPTFREYFSQKKSGKGFNFEQAKVLVLSYSRLNNTQIPARFQAIVNLDSEQQLQLKSIQESRFNNKIGGPNQQVQQFTQKNSNYPINTTSMNHIQTSQVVSPPPYLQAGFSIPVHHQPYQSNNVFYQQQPYYQPAQIAYQTRIEHPLIPNNVQPYYHQNVYNPHPQPVQITHNQQENNHPSKRQILLQQKREEHNINYVESQKNKKSIRNRGITNISLNQGDDLAANSLPNQEDRPEISHQVSNKALGQLGLYSEINVKGARTLNSQGFGTASTQQIKYKQSDSPMKKLHENRTNKATAGKAVKYYFTLDEQQEMDPDIAADLAKYLS